MNTKQNQRENNEKKKKRIQDQQLWDTHVIGF